MLAHTSLANRLQPQPGPWSAWPGSVRVYAATLADLREAASTVADLAPNELARLASITHARTHEQFARGRAWLRQILSLELGQAPSDLNIIVNPLGKPTLADDARHFNLSHSQDQFLLATAQAPIGIDIESHRPLNDLPAMLRRYFRPREIAAIEALIPQEQPAAFFQAWAAKEALLKATGAGVRDLELCEIEIRHPEPPRVLRYTTAPWHFAAWRHRHRADSAASAALAMIAVQA
ncbi:MAG: 4'-phosphopantetheinyl transferase family protein [Gemmataceae bacterium]